MPHKKQLRLFEITCDFAAFRQCGVFTATGMMVKNKPIGSVLITQDEMDCGDEKLANMLVQQISYDLKGQKNGPFKQYGYTDDGYRYVQIKCTYKDNRVNGRFYSNFDNVIQYGMVKDDVPMGEWTTIWKEKGKVHVNRTFYSPTGKPVHMWKEQADQIECGYYSGNKYFPRQEKNAYREPIRSALRIGSFLPISVIAAADRVLLMSKNKFKYRLLERDF